MENESYYKIKEDMIKTINTNLKYRNLKYTDLITLNNIIRYLKLHKYDECIKEILDLYCAYILEDKLGFYDRRKNYDK